MKLGKKGRGDEEEEEEKKGTTKRILEKAEALAANGVATGVRLATSHPT